MSKKFVGWQKTSRVPWHKIGFWGSTTKKLMKVLRFGCFSGFVIFLKRCGNVFEKTTTKKAIKIENNKMHTKISIWDKNNQPDKAHYARYAWSAHQLYCLMCARSAKCRTFGQYELLLAKRLCSAPCIKVICGLRMIVVWTVRWIPLYYCCVVGVVCWCYLLLMLFVVEVVVVLLIMWSHWWL